LILDEGFINVSNETVLIEGERLFGRYTVVLLQPTQDKRWQPSTMQLNGIITNFRIVLRPLKRKYAPATLPSYYIKNIELTKQDNYNCIAVTLITDDILYLMLSTGNLEDLYYDLRTMKAPPPKYKFDETVARSAIERIVEFLKKAPSPNI
jgi:hypothetical protein